MFHLQLVNPMWPYCHSSLNILGTGKQILHSEDWRNWQYGKDGVSSLSPYSTIFNATMKRPITRRWRRSISPLNELDTEGMRVRPASWAKRIALATRGSGDKRHLHFVDTNSNFTFSHLARPFNSSGLKFVSLSSQFYFLPSSVASRAGRLLVWSLSSTLLERFVFVFFSIFWWTQPITIPLVCLFFLDLYFFLSLSLNSISISQSLLLFMSWSYLCPGSSHSLNPDCNPTSWEISREPSHLRRKQPNRCYAPRWTII